MENKSTANINATFDKMLEYREFHSIALYFTLTKCAISPIIIIGNAFTVVIVTRSVTMMLPSYTLIAALATYDFVIGLLPWLQLTLLLMAQNMIWEKMCLFFMLLDAFSTGLDAICIIIIATERFIFITKFSVYNKYVTRKRVKYLVTVVSLVILLAGSVYMYLRELDTRYGICYWQLMSNKRFTRFGMLPIFVVNTVLLFVLYMKIIWFIWKKRQAVVGITSHHHIITSSWHHHGNHPDSYKLQKKTTRMMAVILGIYLVTVIPLSIYVLFLPDNNVSPWQLVLLDSGVLIWYCNAAVNPFVYARKSPEFKNAYSKIFAKCCKGQTEIFWISSQTGITVN